MHIEKGPDVSKDTLERISYILGIFKAINILLPIPGRANDLEALRAWKEESGPEIGEETKLRMSYVLGIFNTLLPIPEVADAWMRKPNEAPMRCA